MSTASKVDGRKRLAAVVAVLLVAGVVAATVGRVVDEPLRVASEFLLVVVAVGGAWVALTTTKARRATAELVSMAAVAALIVSVINAHGYRILSVVVRIVVLVVAVALAKFALGTTVGTLKQSETEGTPVPAATRGVLFMNLKSGGGKAERFHLVDECRRRGIQPVVLEPGQDWLQLVRDVAGSGVDVLGMAGGDGSQAMVGTVAVEMGLPMVVVPAGTRNHLALDLGLDRDDVVGALDGYGEAVERTMDLADVNGHVFVNNVSLGLYAAVVRSAGYRDNKVDTTLATLPQVLGRDSEPFDLRFTGADGAEHRGAHVIQISNNPYGTTFGGRGSRPRMDTHQLGVVTLVLAKRGDAAVFLAALASGHPERFGGLSSWTTPTFEVTADAPIEMGLDGETRVMESPLRFSIRPSPVRVRLPKHAIGYSPAAQPRSAGGSPCADCGRRPSVRSPHERRARLRLSGLAGGTARGGDGGPPDAPDLGRRPGTARVRQGRPCRLPSDCRHTDTHARRAPSTPLRARKPLEAVARHRGATVRAWGTQRPKGSDDRARRGRYQLGLGEPADEAGQQTGAPRPRGGGGPGRAPRTDADLHVVPVGSLGVCVRVRRGGCRIDSAPRRTVARSGCGGRILPCAHGCALPGRRHRRVSRRGDDRRGDRVRNACIAPSSRSGSSSRRFGRPLVPSRVDGSEGVVDRVVEVVAVEGPMQPVVVHEVLQAASQLHEG